MMSYLDMEPSPSRHDHVPPGTGMFGLQLFLASLSVLFAASMVAYLLIRSTAQAKGLAYGSLRMPVSLWFSTVLIVAGSFTIHQAVGAIREGRRSGFRRAIMLTAILGLLFLIVQAPSLYWVLQTHFQSRAHNIFLYGLVLLLIALHALHVLGGLIPLGVTTVRAMQGHYTPANHEAVRYCAVYWHFLDVVWLVMFGVLYFTG
jgi:cytochrome c oxidase subunit III